MAQQGASPDDPNAYGQMRSAVKSELGKAFRPEFLNRLDEIIVFAALQRQEVLQVADLMLAELQARCAESDVKLELSPALKQAVCTAGFSPTFGARPLRRAVQRLCEDAIAEAVLDGFVLEGEALSLDATPQGVVLLKNKRGRSREHSPPAGQGIEDDDAGAPAAAAVADALPAYDMGLQPLTRPTV